MQYFTTQDRCNHYSLLWKQCATGSAVGRDERMRVTNWLPTFNKCVHYVEGLLYIPSTNSSYFKPTHPLCTSNQNSSYLKSNHPLCTPNQNTLKQSFTYCLVHMHPRTKPSQAKNRMLRGIRVKPYATLGMFVSPPNLKALTINTILSILYIHSISCLSKSYFQQVQTYKQNTVLPAITHTFAYNNGLVDIHVQIIKTKTTLFSDTTYVVDLHNCIPLINSNSAILSYKWLWVNSTEFSILISCCRVQYSYLMLVCSMVFKYPR